VIIEANGEMRKKQRHSDLPALQHGLRLGQV